MMTLSQLAGDAGELVIIAGAAALFARAALEIPCRIGNAADREWCARHGYKPPTDEVVFTLLPPFCKLRPIKPYPPHSPVSPM